MGASDTFAIFGLFLLLAFVVPGSVYTFFSFIYFPEFIDSFLEVDPTTAIGVVIVLGLLITSICYAIELIIVHRIYRKLGTKIPNYTLLAKTEAQGKSNFYINQVFGQYIMHFNIGTGILLLWIAFVAIHRFEIAQFFGAAIAFNTNDVSSDVVLPEWTIFYKLFGGLLLAIVNIYLSVGPFREHAINAQNEYEK